MNKYVFRSLYNDLVQRVEKEGKKNPSWLMGYLQGKGNEKLTGYQCAALIDLLFVPLEDKQNFTKAVSKVETLEEAAAVPEDKESRVAAPNKLILK